MKVQCSGCIYFDIDTGYYYIANDATSYVTEEDAIEALVRKPYHG